jgi:hypothetical protein
MFDFVLVFDSEDLGVEVPDREVNFVAHLVVI